MAEENKKSTLPLHMHLVKVGSRVNTDTLTIKRCQMDIEEGIIRCPCCGYEFDTMTITNDMTVKAYNQSLNGYEYAQFKCPECSAIIRTDPYLVTDRYGNEETQLLNGNAIWLKDISDFDHIPNKPGYSLDFDSSKPYRVLVVLVIASIILCGSIIVCGAIVLRGAIFSLLLPILSIGALLIYRANRRKKIMRIYETEKPDEIPEHDEEIEVYSYEY